jgi:hypothetical protein
MTALRLLFLMERLRQPIATAGLSPMQTADAWAEIFVA